MTRVAVVSPAPVGAAMASPAIRAYQVARALARDLEVTLVAPDGVDGGPEGVEAIRVESAELEGILGRFDGVVAQRLPPGAMLRLAGSGVRVVHDLYTPSFVESLASFALRPPDRRRLELVRAETALQQLALATANAFVCTSERQRDFWIGWLSRLGRVDLAAYHADPTLRGLIDVVPFGLPPEPPEPGPTALKGVVRGIGESDRVLLWAGGVLDWTDPLTVIRAVERLGRARDDVKLFFLGLDESQGAMAERAVALARELGVLGRSVLTGGGWVPYGERQRYLLESDLGIAAYRDGLEHRLAFRARLLDYFWAGLPTVTTRGDALGDLVEARGLGRAVDAGDVEGWVDAVSTLLDSGAEYARALDGLAGVRAELSWDRVVVPLRRLLEVPGARVRAPRARVRTEELWARMRASSAQRGPIGLARRGLERAIPGRRSR